MWLILTKKRLIYITLILLIVAGTLFYFNYNDIQETSVVDTNKPKGYVVIIIDDFGYGGDGTKEMLDLEIPITAAVMPFKSHSHLDAQLAVDHNKEVILHMPMETNSRHKEWVGKKSIECKLGNQDIKDLLDLAFEDIGYAVGMNNHMGSRATQDIRVMTRVMEVIKDKDLFFVDSRTSPTSMAKKAADTVGVPFFTRNIFLDGTQNISFIKKQLNKLSDIALRNDYAIAIGHVGPEGGKVTAKAIKELYPSMQKKGIKFVTISELMEILSECQNQQ
mgnify:CR=1 FL=1